jgi:hypothetical protein
MKCERNRLSHSVFIPTTVQNQHPVFGFSINSNEGNFRGLTIAYVHVATNPVESNAIRRSNQPGVYFGEKIGFLTAT